MRQGAPDSLGESADASELDAVWIDLASSATATRPGPAEQPAVTRQPSSEHYWLQESHPQHEPNNQAQQQLLPALAALRLAGIASPAGGDEGADGSEAGVSTDGMSADGGSPTRQRLLPRKLSSAAAASDAAGSSGGRLFAPVAGIQGMRVFSGLRPADKAPAAAAGNTSAEGSFSLLAAEKGAGVAGAVGSSSAADADADAAQHKQGTRRRWQAAAANVMALQRVATSFAPGSLQGLDVRRHNYDRALAGLHTDVRITVVDYSHEQTKVVSDISNAALPGFLATARPAWSKVRWINVQGLSWDVIQVLAVCFDLHPLAVEDIVHVPQRIKADSYQNYLYTSAILVAVDRPSNLDVQQQAATASAGTGAAGARYRRQSTSGGGGGGGTRRFRTRLLQPSSSRATLKAVADGGSGGSSSHALLQPMELMVEQVSFFLFRDGTLISLFSSEGEGISHSIVDKLKGLKTLLTDSEDASFLFNSLLDAVVDHTLPVVQVYASHIAALEVQVLLEKRPQASLTKELHLLSNDLKVLRRTLVPTRNLIHKLQTTHAPDKPSGQGFLSPLTVLYMSDILDHISSVVDDMEVLAEDARDLIDLIFNTISHHNNTSMQMLAVVSTIFLPITFIAGVYGTNFQGFFPEIHWQYGYCFFWGLCLAVTVAFVALLKRWGMFTS